MTDPSVWGTGDLVAVTTGAIITAGGAYYWERNRTLERMIVLLGTGISLAPLLLIILDPFAQVAGIQMRLLTIALAEGRASLWWAAMVASLYLVRDIAARP